MRNQILFYIVILLTNIIHGITGLRGHHLSHAAQPDAGGLRHRKANFKCAGHLLRRVCFCGQLQKDRLERAGQDRGGHGTGHLWCRVHQRAVRWQRAPALQTAGPAGHRAFGTGLLQARTQAGRQNRTARGGAGKQRQCRHLCTAGAGRYHPRAGSSAAARCSPVT